MYRLLIVIALALAATLASAQTPAPEQWWSYLAAYAEGPGSIRLNLALRKVAPMADYPYVVVTGSTYSSVGKKGLPEIADLDRLNDLHVKVIAAIAEQSPHVYAGTFTQNFEQLHYVYVKSPIGIEKALTNLYSQFCSGCKTYTNIKHDPSWAAYSQFLFPNEATRNQYGVRLE